MVKSAKTFSHTDALNKFALIAIMKHELRLPCSMKQFSLAFSTMMHYCHVNTQMSKCAAELGDAMLIHQHFWLEI